MAGVKVRPPVSGEILTRAARREGGGAVPGAQTDVVDAEYESLLTRPGEQKSSASAAASAPAPPVPGLDMLRGGGRAERRTTSGNTLFWIFGLVAVAGAFWVAGGHAVLGNAAPLLERKLAAPLRIVHLTSRLEGYGDRKHLLIGGDAVNEGMAAELLPDLSINLLDPEGRTTHYFLGTNGTPLPAGGRFAFSSRLPVPKDGVKSISVTFREYSD